MRRDELDEVLEAAVVLDARAFVPSGDLRQLVASLCVEPSWVLGHAFDGVLWGHGRDRALAMAADRDVEGAPSLREETLIDLRIFNEDREIRLWRTPAGLAGCEVKEEKAAPLNATHHATQERAYLLMGAGNELGSQDGFVELGGPGGQRHAPPRLHGSPTALRVRHYFSRGQSGLLRLSEHRLLRLEESDK